MRQFRRILGKRFLLWDLQIWNILNKLLDRIHAVVDDFLLRRLHDLLHASLQLLLQVLRIKTLR